jgi:hypothetical protein
MNEPRARRAAVFAAPLVISLVSAQRAAPHVRTVDFLLLFAAGALFSVGVMGVIRVLRSGDTAKP